jgi:hypothetical protein
MVQVQLAPQRVMITEAAFQRLRQVTDLGPHPAAGKLSEHLARRSPSISARIIASPETVSMEEVTESSLIPASWRTPPSRWIDH